MNELFCKLNKFNYQKSSSFKVGHTEQGCTQGLDLCGIIPTVKAVNGETISLLFIDTEGLDSDDCQESWHIKIFMASLLISSVFMFNGQKTLNKQVFIDFQWLLACQTKSN